MLTGIGGDGTDRRQGIRDAIANFRFKEYGTVPKNENGKTVYNDSSEVIDIVNDYMWTDRELRHNEFKLESTKGNGASHLVPGNDIGNKGTENTKAKLTQRLRIPFAICIERKQTIASNVMNLLNLFASGIDSVNLLFSNERKELVLENDALAKFTNGNKTLTEIVNNSGLKTNNGKDGNESR